MEISFYVWFYVGVFVIEYIRRTIAEYQAKQAALQRHHVKVAILTDVTNNVLS